MYRVSIKFEGGGWFEWSTQLYYQAVLVNIDYNVVGHPVTVCCDVLMKTVKFIALGHARYSTAQKYVNCAYAVYTHIRVCSYAHTRICIRAYAYIHTRMNAYTCASAFPLLFSTINFLCVALLCKTKHFWI